MPICKYYKAQLGAIAVIFGLYSPGITQQVTSAPADNDYAYAEKLEKDGYKDLAVEQYLLFMQKYPQEKRVPQALRRVGDGYFALNKFAPARAAYEQLILQYPDNAATTDAMYWIARAYLGAADSTAAAMTFERYARYMPASPLAPTAFVGAAKLYLGIGQLERGRRLLFEVIEQYPDNPLIQADARYALLQDFLRQGDYRRAFQAAQSFLKDFSEVTATPEVWLIKGQLHQTLGQYKQALEVFEAIRSRYRNSPAATQAAIATAELQFALGNTLEAQRQLGTVTGDLSDSLSVVAALLQVRFALELHQPAAALETLKKIPDAKTFGVERWRFLAKASAALENYTEALADYARALELVEPGNDSLRCVIGFEAAKTAYTHGAAEPARQYLAQLSSLKQPVAMRPAIAMLDADVLFHLYEDAGRAVRLYSSFIETYPQHPYVDDAQAKLAQSYEYLRNWQLAANEWQRLLRAYPASAFCVMAQNHLQLIRDYYSPDFVSLADDIARTFTGNPIQANAKLQSAEIYFRFHAFDRAVPVLKQLIATEQTDEVRGPALFLLGKSYFALGEMMRLENDARAQVWYDSARVALNLARDKYDSLVSENEFAEFLGLLGLYGTPKAPYASLDSLSQAFPDEATLAPVHLEVLTTRVATAAIGDTLARENIEGRLNKLAALQNGAYRNAASLLLGSFWLQQKDTTAALSVLAKISAGNDIDAARVQAELLRGALLASMGKLDDAIRAFKILRSKYYYSTVADSALLFLARIALKIDLPESTIEFLQELRTRQAAEIYTTLPPLTADQQLLTAQAYEKSGAWLAATRAYLAFVRDHRQDPRYAEALTTLAQVARKMQAPDLARGYYRDILQSDADETVIAEARLLLAELEFEQENYAVARQVALETLRNALSSEQEKRAMRVAIVSALRLGQAQTAEVGIKTYKTKYPDDKTILAEIEYEQGEFYIRQKNFKNAEILFKDMRKDFKGTAYAIRGDFGLGKTLLIQNKTDDALSVLTGIPQKYPGDPFLSVVYLNLGDFYQAQQQWNNAIEAFDKVLADSSKDTTFKQAVRYLINVYERIGAFDRALAYTRQYLAAFPDDDPDFSLQVKIGSFLTQLGQYDDAILQFRALLPLVTGETRSEIQYYIGDGYFRAGRFEKAIVEYLRLKYFDMPTKLPWKVTAIFQAGICYVRLANYPRAKDLFELVIRLEGEQSNFGRVARQKLNEIEQLVADRDAQQKKSVADRNIFVN